MPLRSRTVEEGELPRWVYAMMKANADPNEEEDDSAASRVAKKMRAEMIYRKRQEAVANRDAQTAVTSRTTGLEWKNRPRTTFTSKELDKIIPNRRLSYVFSKYLRNGLIIGAICTVTAATIFCLLAVCISLKLNESAATAWAMFKASPIDYVHHVLGAIDCS